MGYKIKEAREAIGMSQTELAKQSGVSRATIWRLEKGVDEITSTKTLYKIAKALNTTIDNIFFETTVKYT